jgi:hypothetical protein
MAFLYKYPFSEATEEDKLAIWDKGRVIENFDASVWRWDKCGAVMKYSEHGNTNSPHGWEIDHINRFNGKTIARKVMLILGIVPNFSLAIPSKQ